MPDRRFRVQGFVTEPPWTLRFHAPEAYWFKVRFASQPDAGLQDLLLGHAPVVTGLLEEDRAGDIDPLCLRHTSNATPTNALTS